MTLWHLPAGLRHTDGHTRRTGIYGPRPGTPGTPPCRIRMRRPQIISSSISQPASSQVAACAVLARRHRRTRAARITVSRWCKTWSPPLTLSEYFRAARGLQSGDLDGSTAYRPIALQPSGQTAVLVLNNFRMAWRDREASCSSFRN